MCQALAAPGKGRPLLTVPPLRTVRAGFPAYGSSRHKAPGRGRQHGHCSRVPSRSASPDPELPMAAADAGGHRSPVHFLALRRFTRSDVAVATGDQMEVGTAFAAGHVAARYPRHYSATFAFSILLYPLPQQVALRLPCPRAGAATGLPSSAGTTRRGQVRSVRRWFSRQRPPILQERDRPRTLLVQARQLLALVGRDDVYQPFTCVHPIRQPGPLSAW